MKVINKLLNIVTAIENAVMVITFAVMVIAYFISVVNRNIIKGSMPWTEELAVYCMVYMALLGMEVGLRDGTQVSVTAFTAKLRGVAAKAVWVIGQAIMLIFIFMMFKYGLALVTKQLSTGQTSPVMKIPMWSLYLSLVISFGITLVVQIVLLICKLLNINTDEITGLKTREEEGS